MFEDKTKVIPFNDLPFEERLKINFYINQANIRTLQQVCLMLKESIGNYQKRKIKDWERELRRYVDENYELTEKGCESDA